jgi:hypothetical protein
VQGYWAASIARRPPWHLGSTAYFAALARLPRPPLPEPRRLGAGELEHALLRERLVVMEELLIDDLFWRSREACGPIDACARPSIEHGILAIDVTKHVTYMPAKERTW